jgi:MFS family permease
MTSDAAASSRLGSNYWRLWTATAISNVGDGVLLAALPVLATQVTSSAVSIGLITTLMSVPWLLLALPAGALVDRVDRRRVMVSADFFRASLVGVLAIVAAYAEVRMWMLWVLALGLGAGEVFFDSGSQAIVPEIVNADRLERANGLRLSVETAGNTFIGPPLGAALFGVAVWLPFGADAASFVIAAIMVISITMRSTPTSSSPADPDLAPSSWRDDIREGARWTKNHRLIRVFIAASVLGNMSFMIYESTFVLFATKELGVSERGFGLLLAVIGGGALLAGMVADRVATRLGRRTAMLIGAGGPVLATLAIAAAPVAWWVAAMLAVQMMLGTVWSIIAVSIRQRLVPNHLYGRVNSLFRFFAYGAMPIGALLGGVLASVAGLRAPYVASAVLMFLAFLLVVFRLRPAAIDAALAAAAASDPAAVTIDDA